jgi:hypothetical protein
VVSSISAGKRLDCTLLAMNNKLTVGGIVCDLEKAFDCVNHDIFLSEQEFNGVVGKFNTLITSYLSF